MVPFDVFMRVPLRYGRAAGDQHDEAHAFFNQPASQQATACEVVSGRFSDTVEVLSGFGLARNVEHRRRFGLHLEGQVVGVQSLGEFRRLGSHPGLVEIVHQLQSSRALGERHAGRQIENTALGSGPWHTCRGRIYVDLDRPTRHASQAS